MNGLIQIFKQYPRLVGAICFVVIFILLTAFQAVKADQLSYMESTRLTNDSTYYTAQDRRLQYNFGDEDYYFLTYRRAGVCPSYCGFNYDMFGAGIGKNHKIGIITLFAQVGYYWVKNSVGKTDDNENLFLYLNTKYGFNNIRHFKSYEVKNENAPGISVGVDIPLNNHTGIKLSYQYLKIKENIIGYLTDPPDNINIYHDPVNRDFSTINAGVYVCF